MDLKKKVNGEPLSFSSISPIKFIFFTPEFQNLLIPEIPLGSNANINELLLCCMIGKNCLPPSTTPVCFCYSIPTHKKTKSYDIPSDHLWH